MKWKILTKKTRLVPLISAPFHSISPTMIRFLHWKLISLSASRWGEGVKTYRQKNGRADRPTDRELYIQIDRQTFIYMQVKINSQCGKQTGLHWYFKKKVWHYGPVAQWTRGTMDLWHYGLFPERVILVFFTGTIGICAHTCTPTAFHFPKLEIGFLLEVLGRRKVFAIS